MGEAFLTIVLAYLFMSFVKFAFGVPSLPVVIGAHMKLQKRRDEECKYEDSHSCFGTSVVVVLTTIFYSIAIWPYMLFIEKHKFFSVYSKQKILRDVLLGWYAAEYREMD